MPRISIARRVSRSFPTMTSLLGALLVAFCWHESAQAQWTATDSMKEARYDHASVLLSDGRVLVAGGSAGSAVKSTAEVYAPSTGTWSSVGSMPASRSLFAGARLASNKVLISGGSLGAYFGSWTPSGITGAALFDPVSNTWSSTGSMSTPRFWHTLTLLSSGKVLSVGDSATCELYNPATSTWSATGSLAFKRGAHAAVLLPGDKVMVIGGSDPTGSSAALTSCEIYNAASGTWSSTGSMATSRSEVAAALLPSGKVMVIGGYTPAEGPINSVEIWDPATGTWSAGPPMTAERQDHVAIVLGDGRVLVTGGLGYGVKYAQKTSEIYNPSTGAWLATEDLISSSRLHHGATKLADGAVLLSGGWETNAAERQTFSGGGGGTPTPSGFNLAVTKLAYTTGSSGVTFTVTYTNKGTSPTGGLIVSVFTGSSTPPPASSFFGTVSGTDEGLAPGVTKSLSILWSSPSLPTKAFAKVYGGSSEADTSDNVLGPLDVVPGGSGSIPTAGATPGTPAPTEPASSPSSGGSGSSKKRRNLDCFIGITGKRAEGVFALLVALLAVTGLSVLLAVRRRLWE